MAFMSLAPPYTICFPPKTKQEKQKDLLTYQHYDTLISTLPKSSQTHTNLSLFRGFWFPNDHNFGLKVLQGTMAAIDHFVPRHNDILLASLPKVGTTWLKALAFAILNRNNHPYPRSYLLSLNPHQCVPFLEYQLYTNDRIPDMSLLPSPRLLATHIPYSLLPPSLPKIVYLCRNPKDTFISMWKFANSLLPEDYKPTTLEDFFEMFLSGVYISGPFWDNVLEYWRASKEERNKVLFMRYEELKRDPEGEVRRLAKFMGYPFSREEEEAMVVAKIVELCSLKSLKRLKVNQTTETEFWTAGFDNRAFFRKGVIGDWINHFSPEMAEKFDKVIEENFRNTGLTFK